MSQFTLPRLIAHRGASVNAPENTLSAIYTAKEMGATWVEFDVKLSGDKVPMIFHDEDLTRTTNGSGSFSSLSFIELKKLDAGSWFSSEYVDERIPTLTEMLVLCDNLGLGINIELKPTDVHRELMILNVLDEVNGRWPKQAIKPLFSSFDNEILFLLRKADPDCNIAVLLHEWDPRWTDYADALQAVSVHVNEEKVSEKHIKEILQTNRQVACYTVNSLARATELFKIGVQAVFSDHADLGC